MLAAMPSPSDPLPPARNRDDACPGALRLHSADDGALARVRVPGGVLDADRAGALADAAERFGDGSLHLTSRGNVQLRGLGGNCGGPLAELLEAAGLLPSRRHERVRNIVASPLSGIDRTGRPDVQPWARTLDGLLCASEAAAELSGRFLFAFDDGRGDVAALGADVTIVAESGGAHVALHLGDAPALRVPGAAAPRAALAAAETFVTTARDGGTHAWRIRELPDSGLALTHEVERRLTAEGVAAGAADTVLPRGRGRGPEPGAVDGPDGTRTLSVLAPLGRLTVAQWRRLADIARRDGRGELRLTPWRGAVVPGLVRDAAALRLDALRSAGLVTDSRSNWIGVGACTGRPGCAKSLADVRADAEAALRPAPGGLPVYWSGCERRCGHPRGEWVDVLATGDGYAVSARGVRQRPAAQEPARHVARTQPSDLASAVAAARTTPPRP
ncbi:precorrin-3B synthase [Streptomyces sp. NPDC047108]|uniref:precorrin-3B synthase n=1 Tax=Streptomyces sp. NPDC047108 TaxID=3155025 RepID=UPI0033D91D77